MRQVDQLLGLGPVGDFNLCPHRSKLDDVRKDSIDVVTARFDAYKSTNTDAYKSTNTDAYKCTNTDAYTSTNTDASMP
jgi:hypothetical protein